MRESLGGQFLVSPFLRFLFFFFLYFLITSYGGLYILREAVGEIFTRGFQGTESSGGQGFGLNCNQDYSPLPSLTQTSGCLGPADP